jgi:hypothetical protein
LHDHRTRHSEAQAAASRPPSPTRHRHGQRRRRGRYDRLLCRHRAVPERIGVDDRSRVHDCLDRATGDDDLEHDAGHDLDIIEREGLDAVLQRQHDQPRQLIRSVARDARTNPRFDHLRNLAWLGMPLQLGFREDQFAIEDDLEPALRRGQQLDVTDDRCPPVQQLVRQTDGTGNVVSGDAELDGQFMARIEHEANRTGRAGAGGEVGVGHLRAAPRCQWLPLGGSMTGTFTDRLKVPVASTLVHGDGQLLAWVASTFPPPLHLAVVLESDETMSLPGSPVTRSAARCS